IPDAVIEAARIDGAGEFRVLLTIVLPMSVPMIATMTLLIGLAYWNDWKNGLYYLQQSKSLYSIQVLLNDMLRDVQALKSGMDAASAAEISATMPSIGIKMAIAVVGVLPILVVYPFFQKYFVKGITIGAVKG
ncbi:MAG: carbohydrate ABC transporter permease, partial [Acutalibacter sp.]|nr:carbohydrate ABC transporter permease [Acutalibacter sp.]